MRLLLFPDKDAARAARRLIDRAMRVSMYVAVRANGTETGHTEPLLRADRYSLIRKVPGQQQWLLWVPDAVVARADAGNAAEDAELRAAMGAVRRGEFRALIATSVEVPAPQMDDDDDPDPGADTGTEGMMAK